MIRHFLSLTIFAVFVCQVDVQNQSSGTFHQKSVLKSNFYERDDVFYMFKNWFHFEFAELAIWGNRISFRAGQIKDPSNHYPLVKVALIQKNFKKISGTKQNQ